MSIKEKILKRYVSKFAIVILLAFVGIVLFASPTDVLAATYVFSQPTIAVSKPVNFINGSFEEPNWQTLYSGSFHSEQYSTYQQESNVPGWSVYPVNSGNVGSQYWDYMQFFNINNNKAKMVSSVLPDGGTQFVEENASYPSRLFQTCQTVPQSRIYWEFYHAATPINGSGKPSNPATAIDTINFRLYNANVWNGKSSPPSGSLITTGNTSVSEKWKRYAGAYNVPAGQTSTIFSYDAASTWAGQLDFGNYLDACKFQTGASLIAEKAVYNSSGTRIDGGYGEYSDIITIKIKVTNWGETDAAPCVLNDTLWDGLTFVDGSVSGDSGVVGNVTASGDVVTARFGEGATSTAGGTLKGSQSMGTAGTTGKGKQAIITIRAKITGTPGSTIKNQSSVNYNDKGFESYNPASGLTSYSMIDYGISNANNLGVTGQNGTYTMNMLNADGTVARSYKNVDKSKEETYVNQFTIVDRQTNGTVWADANENGNIDTGERLISGQSVKMQVTTDNGATWTDAKDWSGSALVTTTDANGKYVFKGILSGKYRVLTQLPSGYRVSTAKDNTALTEVSTSTGAQGTPNNNAATDNGWAVVQILDKTSSVFTPTANTFYTNNADIGLVPTVSLKKDAMTGSAGTIQNGTDAAPASVLYGDTITYTLTAKNNGTDAMTSSSTLVDTLPANMTYVSSTVPTGVSQPTVSGQTVTWTIPSVPGSQSVVVTVKARVIAPNVSFINAATFTEADGTADVSNSTYHKSKGLELTFSKTVAGEYGDKGKEFTFYVDPGYVQKNSLLKGLTTTSSPYTGSSTVTGVSAPAGGTFNYDALTKIKLMHGQSITIHDLPMGIRYLIQEGDYSGYTVTAAITNETVNPGAANTSSFNSSSTLTSGVLNSNNAAVAYTNTRNAVVPTDADTGGGSLWPIAAGAAILSFMVISSTVLIKMKQSNKKGKHAR